MAFDLEKIRADFPALKQKIHGNRLVYLDSGASAQKPNSVINRISEAYTNNYSNVHRGLHTLSNRATEAYEGAREIVAEFVGAKSVNRIVFTRSATEAINLVAQSYASTRIGEGDEIALSIMEHHSNIVPWNFLRERNGAVLNWFDVKDDGSFDMEAFENSLNEKTKLVAITHMSNVLGTVSPLKHIIEIAHKRGIVVLVDGSQGIVHRKVDVIDLDVDFYIGTGHKLYGPTGIGFLYAKEELLNEMRPYQGGGEMISEVTLEGVTYNDPPFRFEAGTPPIVQAIGMGEAINYINNIGRDEIEAHENDLGEYAAQRLGEIEKLRIIGNSPDKGAIFSFEIENIHAHDLCAILDRYGVAVRAGTHCAQPLLTRFGATSTCRASFGIYNGKDDVDALVEAIEKAKSFFA
ncbi:Cysteine desulfurase =_ SufS [hydrothermal vent metagenome]|uniref:cysteine desulfurase n=1 Tax=hydrothermal vent metagenome TaxID=652676 RepID=A0A3B0UU46_9ZZZZ